MNKWFPLVMVVALAAIGTPLQAGIFDLLVNDTTEESTSLNGGGGEIIHSSPQYHAPAPTMDHGYADHGPAQSGYGYPFKTSCCETQNKCVASLWHGYCSRAHGACDRMQSWFAGCARGHGCKGGCATGNCGKGGGGKGGGGKGGCATGNCGHGGKGFGHVQHGHVQQKFAPQKTHVQRSHVQRSFAPRGHVQHGKGFAACGTCGQNPCGCHAKGHHRKGFSLGFHGKGSAGIGFGKGHAASDCGCGAPAHGKGIKPFFGLGRFARGHHCDTCGKSAGLGFGKGGCDCDSSAIGKGGWSQEGSVIWDKSHSYQAPQHHQPTPANDPPVELNIPTLPETEALPVPPTPTAHSASIRRLPPVAGYQY